MKHQPYSSLEKNIIAQCVKDNPGNVREAFQIASTKIGRTQDAIAHQYYNKIKPARQLITTKSSSAVYAGKNKARVQPRVVENPLFVSVLKRFPQEKLPSLLDRVLSNDTKAEIILAMVATQ